MAKLSWKTDLLPSPDSIALLLQRLAPYGLTPGRLGSDAGDPVADFAGIMELSGPLPPVEDWLIGSDGDLGVSAICRCTEPPAVVLPRLLAQLGECLSDERLRLKCEFTTLQTGRQRHMLQLSWLGPGKTDLTIRPPQYPWDPVYVRRLAEAADLPIAVEETPYGTRTVSTASTWRHRAGQHSSNIRGEGTVGLPFEDAGASTARVVRIMEALGQAGAVGYEWHPYPRDLQTAALAKQLRLYNLLRERQVPADKYRISLRIVLKGLDALEAMRPHLTAEGGEWTAGGIRLPDGRGFQVDVVVTKKGYQILVHSKDHTITAQELQALTGLRWR